MEFQDKKPQKKKPTKIEEMTKEQIRQAILKKRECNAKAQGIVESLLEKDVSESYFLQCLPDINQSHLDDVIEERAIAHQCGYPVCSKSISERDIPKQKYRISTRTNKVYDITARKSFCSNSCYKSAMYIKKQMLTSPLWFREHEDIPTFNLLPLDTVGSLGQEVDLSLIEKINVKSKKEAFTSINDFADASLNDITGTSTENKSSNDESHTNQVIENQRDVCSNETIVTDNKENNDSNTDNRIKIEKENTENESAVSTKPRSKESSINPLNIVGEIVEKPERRVDPILTNTPEQSTLRKTLSSSTNSVKKKPPAVTIITIEVEKCMAEWFTLDTLIFIFGETKVKEMVSNKGDCINEYLNNYAKSIFYTSNTYDQYQALCRKLNMLELEDRKLDAQALQRETKPLPDFSILQEESKKMQLKVKAFLAGETAIPEVEISEKNEVPEEDSNLTQLPLVDKNAQNALRRRIVCQHLNKVLPDLLRSLGLLTLSINSDVRLIVNTFKLKANNIMFKPIQWTLIGIVILKLLSLRDKRLEYLLQSPTAYQHLQLLLLSYKQDGGYLDRLISWLTDVDRLLDTNDTQLTIE